MTRKARRVGYHLLLPAAAAALVASAAPLGAQEGPVTFEFSFSNPGARSMALGGAFAALADDATAAFANPAGLVQLLEPEVSLEGRHWQYDTPFVTGGRATGEPTGIGIDTIDGLATDTSSYDVSDISFLSVVYPGSNWSFAAYRHSWADFELASEVNGIFFAEGDAIERTEDVVSETDFRIVNNGLACAWQVSQGLSLGLGIVYYEVELNSLSEEYTYDDAAFFEPNPHLAHLLDTTYAYRADDSGLAFDVGLLWRPSPVWSLGAYYRRGPRMTLSFTETKGPADDDYSGDAAQDTTSRVGPVDLPEVYGLGLAYRSQGGAWTASLEWARVGYSAIGEDFDGFVFDRGQLALDDGDELHLGFEYVFASSRPIVAVRLGAWHDPAHGFGAGAGADIDEQAIYTGGDDQIHYTGGIGVVFERAQIDLGFDLSDTVDQLSLSMVYRF
jgi:long-subunit fatty acid transport protein